MPIYALVDCNNFYASCERVFNPRLNNKPVIILSNNDGCIIARSNEAKALGIPMGAPFYQWKNFCKQHHIHVLSSNYELYGDMSGRVMTTFASICPNMEIYSIDEAFLVLDGFKWKNTLTEFAFEIKNRVLQWTGIPVSIGIGQTKTLAKIANKIAKTQTSTNVFEIMDLTLQEQIMKHFPVEDIWGIGSRLAKRLHKMNIKTAQNLRDADPKAMRIQFNVTMEKMISELRGISCLPLESFQPRKQIISSRSFGYAVTALKNLEEAISYYAATAALKLRKQRSLTQGISVFLHTNTFRSEQHLVIVCVIIFRKLQIAQIISHTSQRGVFAIYIVKVINIIRQALSCLIFCPIMLNN